MVAALVMDVSPSAAEFEEAVGAHVCVRFCTVLYSLCIYCFVRRSLCHLLPPHNDGHQLYLDFSSLLSLPDDAEV